MLPRDVYKLILWRGWRLLRVLFFCISISTEQLRIKMLHPNDFKVGLKCIVAVLDKMSIIMRKECSFKGTDTLSVFPATFAVTIVQYVSVPASTVEVAIVSTVEVALVSTMQKINVGEQWDSKVESTKCYLLICE